MKKKSTSSNHRPICGLESYKVYNAMNMHLGDFTDYDYAKYNGKTKVKDETFKKNPFRWQFCHLEKNYSLLEIKHLLYLCFKENDFVYIAPKRLFQLIRQIQNKEESFDKVYSDFEFDLAQIFTTHKPEELFKTGNLYPLIYELHKEKGICLETILILNEEIKSYLHNEASRDIIAWPNEVDRLSKISTLLYDFIDRDIVKSIISKQFPI